MRSYLIVANQTVGSPALRSAISERLATGEARFHVVVPATTVSRALTWDEDEAAGAAKARLAELIERLEGMGAAATGEVGVSDPVAAVLDAMRLQRFDEVILSTLPPGISRWLGQDVPTRLRGSVAVQVAVVIAPRDAVFEAAS